MRKWLSICIDFAIGFFIPIVIGVISLFIVIAVYSLTNQEILFFIPLTLLVVKLSGIEGFIVPPDWVILSSLLLFFAFIRTRRFISIGALVVFMLAIIVVGYSLYYGVSSQYKNQQTAGPQTFPPKEVEDEIYLKIKVSGDRLEKFELLDKNKKTLGSLDVSQWNVKGSKFDSSAITDFSEQYILYKKHEGYSRSGTTVYQPDPNEPCVNKICIFDFQNKKLIKPELPSYYLSHTYYFSPTDPDVIISKLGIQRVPRSLHYNINSGEAIEVFDCSAYPWTQECNNKTHEWVYECESERDISQTLPSTNICLYNWETKKEKVIVENERGKSSFAPIWVSEDEIEFKTRTVFIIKDDAIYPVSELDHFYKVNVGGDKLQTITEEEWRSHITKQRREPYKLPYMIWE